MDSRPGANNASTAGQIAARAALAGTRFAAVEWVTETGSTNRDLLERVEADRSTPEGQVLVTDHQTAGRGTKGRSWFDPPGGSLLVSVLLRPRLAAVKVHLLTMAFGLAASDACREVAGVDVGLKWPNDLFVGERKLAGILAEARWSADQLDAVVIGMGMNVNWPPEVPTDLGEIAVALNQVIDTTIDATIDRPALLVALLRSFEALYGSVTSPAGEAELLARYRERSVTIGRRVRVELTEGPFEGDAVDVTDEGHLIVVTATERRVFASGDIVHVRAS